MCFISTGESLIVYIRSPFTEVQLPFAALLGWMRVDMSLLFKSGAQILVTADKSLPEIHTPQNFANWSLYSDKATTIPTCIATEKMLRETCPFGIHVLQGECQRCRNNCWIFCWQLGPSSLWFHSVYISFGLFFHSWFCVIHLKANFCLENVATHKLLTSLASCWPPVLQRCCETCGYLTPTPPQSRISTAEERLP